MKTIGMIGGLSWHSSLQMYEYINSYIAGALGEFNCAKMVLANVNLQEVFVTRKDEQEQVLLEAAEQLERADSGEDGDGIRRRKQGGAASREAFPPSSISFLPAPEAHRYSPREGL